MSCSDQRINVFLFTLLEHDGSVKGQYATSIQRGTRGSAEKIESSKTAGHHEILPEL